MLVSARSEAQAQGTDQEDGQSSELSIDFTTVISFVFLTKLTTYSPKFMYSHLLLDFACVDA